MGDKINIIIIMSSIFARKDATPSSSSPLFGNFSRADEDNSEDEDDYVNDEDISNKIMSDNESVISAQSTNIRKNKQISYKKQPPKNFTSQNRTLANQYK